MPLDRAPPASFARRSTMLLTWFVVALGLCLFVPGCGGCVQSDPAAQAKAKKKKEEDEKKKKLEKPKPDFEAGNLILEPGEAKASSYDVKPGHWTTASQAFKANNGDLPAAEFESASVDNKGRPLEIDHTSFQLIMSRPASLPKGQTKHFEFLYYIPRRVEGLNNTVALQNSIYARGGGREIYRPAASPVTRMPAYQYHLLVLASDPDRYGYVKRLESVSTVADELGDQPSLQYYRVSLPKLDKRVPLPTHSLAWTSTAFIFWDGIDPNLLTPDQQTGLIDWLHFGGQLVISGPDSLDSLRGSFLGDYLPAEKVAAKELTQETFSELNKNWSLPDKKKVLRTLDVVEGKPPIGVELKLIDGGEFVPTTGDLVAERRVGRGRIAVTAFSLTGRTIINWASYDNFFNGVLLRRFPRKFTPGEFNSARVSWADDRGKDIDPRLSSTVRYFSRDIGFLTAPDLAPPPIADTTTSPFPQRVRKQMQDAVAATESNPVENDWHFDGYGGDPQSGVAGWNDFSAASDAARSSLREAAGISIPKADFVLKVIAVYILVLVPLNWLVFRLIGRVEWAWVAAPIIAVIGAGAVVRMAQLDIGFARSHTELNILEVPAGLDRAHLTRYAALYSSLSTNYDFHFDDPAALAQPFPTRHKPPQLSLSRTEPATCFFKRDQGVTLSGFVVRSNTTDFVHCEQMLPLGGAFKLSGSDEAGWQLDNQSDFAWKEAAVLRGVGQDKFEIAYLGDLPAKRNVKLRFDAASSALLPEAWKESPTLSGAASDTPTLSLKRVADLATRQLRLDPGEFRLIGWTDENVPGLTVEPQAAQTTSRTLAIVHLREAPLPKPRSDENLRIQAVDEELEKQENTLDPLPPAEAPPK